MWAELALNESKQGIIRNWFTFFLLFLFLCNGSIIIRCASGRGGKAPQPRACLSAGGPGSEEGMEEGEVLQSTV